MSRQTEMRVSQGEREAVEEGEDEEIQRDYERRRPSISRQTGLTVSQGKDHKISVNIPKQESRSHLQVASSSRLSSPNQLSHNRTSGEDSNMNVNVIARVENLESQERARELHKRYGNIIPTTRDETQACNSERRQLDRDVKLDGRDVMKVHSSQRIEAQNTSDSKPNSMPSKGKKHDATPYRGDYESKGETNSEISKVLSPQKKRIFKKNSMKAAQEISDASKSVPKGSQGFHGLRSQKEKNLGPTIKRTPWIPCKVQQVF